MSNLIVYFHCKIIIIIIISSSYYYHHLFRSSSFFPGKPLWEARGDITYCADTMEYYGGLAPSVTGQHVQMPNGSFAFTRREPLGVVGGNLFRNQGS